MPISKEHLEFVVPDLTEGWATPPGYPEGIKQKILAGSLDEAGKSGSRTRLLRFDPGVYTTERVTVGGRVKQRNSARSCWGTPTVASSQS